MIRFIKTINPLTCQHYLKKKTLTQLKSNKNISKKEWDRIRKKSRVNVLVKGNPLYVTTSVCS